MIGLHANGALGGHAPSAVSRLWIMGLSRLAVTNRQFILSRVMGRSSSTSRT
jgi:hypothetical protein